MIITGPRYRLPRRGVRRLHIDGVEYLYSITGSKVLFFLEGRKIVADFTEVTGRTLDVLERGEWKRTCDGMVTPRDCKAFLVRILTEEP